MTAATMHNRPVEQVALDHLTYSGMNVRSADDLATDKELTTLAASIESIGLLAPPIVGKPKRKGASQPVYAGRRRLAALRLLVDAGKLAADAPVTVIVVEDEAEATEVSLAENYARQQMAPVEIYDAFATIRRQKPDATPAEIGAMFGYDAQRTARILRIANLSHKVMEAYRAGTLTDAQAQAFAATEDRDLQDRVLGEIDGIQYEHQRGPAAIKRLMGAMDQDERAMFDLVGRIQYEAEGGIYEEDLFERGAGRIMNPEILKRLYHARVKDLQSQFSYRLKRDGRMIKTDGAWGLADLDIAFVSEPPQTMQYGYRHTDDELRIRTPKVEPAGADIAHPDTVIVLPKKGAIVVTTTLKANSDNGAYLAFDLWYRDKAAKGGAQGADPKAAGTSTPNPKSDAQKRREAMGLVKDTAGAACIIRRDLVRDQLFGDPILALDLLIFTQARTILRPKKSFMGGSYYDGQPHGIETPACQMTGTGAPPKKQRDIADTVTRASTLKHQHAILSAHPAFTMPDPIDGFARIRMDRDRILEPATALVAGWGIRAADNFYQDPEVPRFVEHISADYMAEAEGAAPWHSLVEMDQPFFELLTHKTRVRILQDWGQTELAGRVKSKDSAAECAKIHAACIEGYVGASEAVLKLLAISADDAAEIANWRPDWMEPTRPAPLPAATVAQPTE